MTQDLVVRVVSDADRAAWLAMRPALWPGDKRSHENEINRYFRGDLREPEYVALAELNGKPVGFAEFSIRAYAEGCVTDKVGYLEGVYVVPDERRKGIGQALIAHGEGWAAERGCTEFASDANIDNDVSTAIHNRVGFTEVGCIRCFRKTLPAPDTGDADS